MSPDERTERWAHKLIDAGLAAGPLPLFGSPDWWDLEPGDPRRMASIVRAAEAWRRHCALASIAQDEAELADLVDRLLAERVRAAMWDVRHSRDDWHVLLRDVRPFAEVEALRPKAVAA